MKEDKVLFLIMKGEFYWRIYNGTKSIEYRAKSKGNMRIKNAQYNKVKLQLGYRKDNVMILDIEKIEETETEFQIHLSWQSRQIISLKAIAIENNFNNNV